MTAKEVIAELQVMGSPSIKKVLMNHGAKEPFYGVKVGDMKKIEKKIKKDYKLALELYNSGISDAMYFAGLIADDEQMTKKDLNSWAEKAYWYMLSEFTVPWVAAGSAFGHELALEWMASQKENIASAGWATYSNLLALTSDSELDLKEISSLLKRIPKEIHKAQNRVRHCMNGFIIAVGCYVAPLTQEALAAAKEVGSVSVDMGGTACKIPFASDYINKAKAKGTLGKKKKTVKC
jgi:3-methyladenine DNA glycosylase AlkD